MMNNSDSEVTKQNADFGSVLAVARKSERFSVEDISAQLKIPVHTILAIESNDIAALPGPTYTQGYIRTYAKFLEISEEKVLDLYNLAVPHDLAAELKPRSSLPGEASSQSPLMKMMTLLLIVAGIAALAYGGFKYYQKQAGVIETELDSKESSFTGNSLDNPTTNHSTLSQQAHLTADEMPPVEKDDLYAGKETADDPDLDEVAVDELVADRSETTSAALTNEQVSEAVENQEPAKDGVQADDQLDVLKIYAEKGSWMQVRDASNRRLLYNTVPEKGSKVLRGHAPFRITLGNARSTNLLINGLAIDMSDYIRDNNTASFTVSTKQENVIFH